MGKKLKYKVETKVSRFPKDLEPLFTAISTAYGNNDDKEKFIAKFEKFKKLHSDELVACWMCKGSGKLDDNEQEYCTIRHATIERNDIPFICKDYQPCS